MLGTMQVDGDKTGWNEFQRNESFYQRVKWFKIEYGKKCGINSKSVVHGV